MVFALLIGAYAKGAWPLGFVMLVPWLLALRRVRGAGGALLSGAAMAVAYTAAAFAWFAPAVADYTGIGTAGALALMLLAAPVLQPQLLVFALVHWRAARGASPRLRIVLASCAWLAAEWALPRVFGDTPGVGLYPSLLLRQGADIAGVPGLTLLLLCVNQVVAETVVRRRAPWRTLRAPALVAVALPLAVACYGAARLAQLRADAADAPVRIGVVQAGIVDYERLRREQGSYATVRQILDAHVARSLQLRAQGAQALVWPETVYPTTFGQPRSESGAQFDRELAAFATHAGVPLVFGTYQRDGAGEYNVAAVLDPARGLLGAYRKTRLFPLTEYVPPWLDGPTLRRALPWAGTWQRGDGARVFPLFLRDGRELPVAPLICRDDTDAALARDAARLGARMLVVLSNDAWFTRAPQGARLHLAAAAFRSVETRLPQVRATTNGISAYIDARGEVVAQTPMGGAASLLVTAHPRAAAGSPFMAVGPVLGPLSLLVLLAWALWRGARRFSVARPRGVASPMAGCPIDGLRVQLLSPWQRVVISALRAVALVSVLAMGLAVLVRSEATPVLAQLRQFAVWVLLPWLAAAAAGWRSHARLGMDRHRMVLVARHETVEIDRSALRGARAWRLPLPLPGLDLLLQDGRRWPRGLATAAAARVLASLRSEPRPAARVEDGGPPTVPPYTASPAYAGDIAGEPLSRRDALLAAFDLPTRWYDRALWKFVAFPLVPALPAFRLHQVIAYGGTFGEAYSFGLRAYLTGLGLWWASWAVAMVLIAGGLRAAAEVVTALALRARPSHAVAARRAALAAARVGYFIGVPAWLAVRMLAG